MVDTETALLDSIDIDDFPVVNHIDIRAFNRSISVYRTLQHVPVEYFMRNSRTVLVRRAIVADMVLWNSDFEGAHMNSFILRVFLKRIWQLVGNVDHPVSCLS